MAEQLRAPCYWCGKINFNYPEIHCTHCRNKIQWFISKNHPTEFHDPEYCLKATFVYSEMNDDSDENDDEKTKKNNNEKR